jgi:hypothetical protein
MTTMTQFVVVGDGGGAAAPSPRFPFIPVHRLGNNKLGHIGDSERNDYPLATNVCTGSPTISTKSFCVFGAMSTMFVLLFFVIFLRFFLVFHKGWFAQ